MAYSGPLPQVVNAGGTGAITLTNHGVVIGQGLSPVHITAAGSSGQLLQSGGAAADPAYTTSTYPSTNAINTLLYASAANTMSALATANNGVLITSATGIPSILPDGTTGQVLTATTGSPPSWASPATSGTVTSVSVVSANGFAGTVATATTTPAITLSTTITGVLSGNGTAISGSAVTQFDVLVGGATNAISSVGPGLAGQVLQSGGAAANPAYSTATYPATTTINQILYSSSNNVVAGLATANQGVLTTGTTGVPVITSLATNGQVIIGSTAGAPAAATLTAGAGIAIANGSNTITISNTGAGFTWHDVTGGSATLAAQNGYIADAASLTTFTMPSNNAIGDTIRVVGKGAGGWTIVYGANQNIIFGNKTSTTTTGDLASTNANDCVELVCTTASATQPIFTVISSIGNITVA